MSRRVVPSRRAADSGNIPLVSSLQQKSRSSPFLTVGLVLVVTFLVIGYSYSGTGFSSKKDALSREEGYPGQQRAKVSELSKFGRPAKLRSYSWWLRYFIQTGLEENQSAFKKFEQAASRRSYQPNCQVFHLNPHT